MDNSERMAGYKIGIINTGEWLKSRVVASVHNEKFLFIKAIKLTDNHFLFYATKEELDKLCKGELPN